MRNSPECCSEVVALTARLGTALPRHISGAQEAQPRQNGPGTLGEEQHSKGLCIEDSIKKNGHPSPRYTREELRCGEISLLLCIGCFRLH